MHDIDTEYRIQFNSHEPWQLVNGGPSLTVENPEGIYLSGSQIVKAAAHLGWKVDSFDFARYDGTPLDGIRREAYSQILMHDYRTGGPSIVLQTLEDELLRLHVTGFRASKQMGMTKLGLHLHNDGRLTTDDPVASATVLAALIAAQ